MYLAESVAGALLEVLVHLELSPVRFPKSYRLLKVEAPDDMAIATLSAAELGEIGLRMRRLRGLPATNG